MAGDTIEECGWGSITLTLRARLVNSIVIRKSPSANSHACSTRGIALMVYPSLL